MLLTTASRAQCPTCNTSSTPPTHRIIFLCQTVSATGGELPGGQDCVSVLLGTVSPGLDTVPGELTAAQGTFGEGPDARSC